MKVPHDREVASAQVAAVYGQVPAAILVTIANAVLLVVALADGPAQAGLLRWLAIMLAVSALRLAIWWAYRRDKDAAEHPARWAWLAAASAVLAGSAWGGGAALLWPESPAAQLLWVFAVGGMSTGAVALHYAQLRAVMGFILPACLPIAGRYLLAGGRDDLAAAAMILVFLAALAAVARRANAQFIAFARLRHDLRRQSHELGAARARLQREIEDHRVTAASLHQAQKMEALGQLTGGIAHDFNNLLMVVLGSLSLLRKRLPGDDARAARLLDNAVEGANRGAVLTQRLLAFGRRQALQPGTVALPALLRGMEDLLRRSIGPGHRLAIAAPPGLPPVLVDASQLELAVLNLVLNARDAMPGEGEIAIALRQEDLPAPAPDGLAAGPYVVLSVTDHGTGMDEATLARATEPFFTTKGVGKGTGLGLSMAYGLAAQSGGRLALRSRKGEGTVVELWLPRAAPGRAAAAPDADAAVARAAEPGRRLRVLLVDDDKLVLASTAAMLEDLGHAVIEAEGGTQALERLRSGTPVEIVVTDFGMPGLSGAELAEEVGRRWPGLPVILVTGYGEIPATLPARVTTLRKPFAQDLLGVAIEAAMRDGR